MRERGGSSWALGPWDSQGALGRCVLLDPWRPHRISLHPQDSLRGACFIVPFAGRYTRVHRGLVSLWSTFCRGGFTSRRGWVSLMASWSLGWRQLSGRDLRAVKVELEEAGSGCSGGMESLPAHGAHMTLAVGGARGYRSKKGPWSSQAPVGKLRPRAGKRHALGSHRVVGSPCIAHGALPFTPWPLVPLKLSALPFGAAFF